MKKVPNSVWQTQLRSEDWNFSIPDRLLKACVAYEYLRENAQRSNQGQWPGLSWSRPFSKARSIEKKISHTFCPPVAAVFENAHGEFLNAEGFHQFRIFIDWRASDTDLLAAFKKQVLTIRPRRAIKKNTGRGSSIAQMKRALRRLGAFRILQYCRGDWKSANEFIKAKTSRQFAKEYFGKNLKRASGWADLKTRVTKDLYRMHRLYLKVEFGLSQS